MTEGAASWFTGVARSGVTHVSFAFLGMGSWAVFANYAHPLPAALLAGVVQGVLSATITLVLKTVVERLAERLSGASALWAPPLIAGMISATLLIAIHRLSQTPELLMTIALPFTIATSYAAVYNYSLWSARRAE